MVLNLFAGIRYSYLVAKEEIQPVLATWILLCVAISLSLWTYYSSKKRNLWSNVANISDFAVVWIILISIALCGDEVNLTFSRFDMVCLIASILILSFWQISKRHATSNLITQGLMTIGYFPTLHELWNASENTEPFGAWIMFLIISVTALIPPIIDKDRLAMIYAIRAVTLVSLVLFCMLRIEFFR